MVRQPYFINRFSGNPNRFFLLHAMPVNKSFRNIFQHRLIVEQVVILKYESRLFPHVVDLLSGNGSIVKRNLIKYKMPAVRFFQKIDAAQ